MGIFKGKAKRIAPVPQCHYCGKFLSYEQMESYSISWIPYGSFEDVEAPDEEWAHVGCWGKNAQSHDLIKRTSWMGPFENIDRNYEYLQDLKAVRG